MSTVDNTLYILVSINDSSQFEEVDERLDEFVKKRIEIQRSITSSYNCNIVRSKITYSDRQEIVIGFDPKLVSIVAEQLRDQLEGLNGFTINPLIK